MSCNHCSQRHTSNAIFVGIGYTQPPSYAVAPFLSIAIGDGLPAIGEHRDSGMVARRGGVEDGPAGIYTWWPPRRSADAELTGAEMNTIVEGLLRSSGPDERPTAVPAATQTAYSSDPEQCKLQCKARFLKSLGLREGATYEEACVSLTKDQPRQWFWGLYCCDSTNCGVYIDHDPTLLEQSPTVDLIINQCRNIGYDDIYDPGPPQITCGDSTPFLIPLNIGPPTLTTSDISISVLSLSTSTASSAIPSDTPTPTAGGGAAATSLPSNDETASKSGRLSDGAKVAIGVCVTLATASLAIALLFMRRRRRNSRGYQRTAPTPAQHSRTDSEPPPQASHMPLMTPPPSSSSKTTPSTPPPLRLNDRKYLPPPYSPSSNTTTPPATPNADGSTISEAGAIISPHAAVPFARSPPSFPAAASRFVVPRHERRATKSAMYYGAPRSTSTIIPGTATLRQSTSSNESGVGLPRSNPPMEQPPVAAAVAPMPTKSTSLLSLPPPSYPARPPRPLTSVPPLEIPDLVTPAGPPPTWALPQPPPPCFPALFLYQRGGTAFATETSAAATTTSPITSARPASTVDAPSTSCRRVDAALTHFIRLAPFLPTLRQFAGRVALAAEYAPGVYGDIATALLNFLQ
ncbi:hypothetical protein PG987_012213 [Apiospora arundinis]